MATPLTLAIDTSESHCSAALVGDTCLAVHQADIGRGHAERLLPLIDEVMAQAGVTFNALDRIAVTNGPGSFTGLRVALSVARGFALSLQIPCLGISGLHCLAAQAARPDTTVHAVMKGRGSQLFYQAFATDDLATATPIAPAENLEIESAASRITAGVVIGSAAELLGLATDKLVGGGAAIIDPVCLARLGQQLSPSDHQPEPHYLREADAIVKKALLPIAHALNPITAKRAD